MIFGKKNSNLMHEKNISHGSSINEKSLKEIVKKHIKYVKSTSPNVHCLTNVVTMQDVANMLLAAGGSAIMAQDIKEMEDITKISSATLINMGVPSDDKIAAYIVAGKTANSIGHPVIFDPVGVGASEYRKKCARNILENVRPDIIRCNQEEAEVLLGFKDTGDDLTNFGKNEIPQYDFSHNERDVLESTKNGELISNGVESSIKLTEAEQEKVAIGLAKKYDAVAFISGSLDVISDGENILKIAGGDARMRKVSGTGCMLSALCTLFAAGEYKSEIKSDNESESKITERKIIEGKKEIEKQENKAKKYFYAAYSAGKVWKSVANNTGAWIDIKGRGIGMYHCMMFDELEKIMG